MNERNRVPALLTAITVAAGAVALGLRAGAFTADDFWDFERLVARIASAAHVTVAIILLTGRCATPIRAAA